MEAKAIIITRDFREGDIVKVLEISGTGRLAKAVIQKNDGTELIVFLNQLEIIND